MAEFLPLNNAEENNDTAWYTAATAGIASGLLKIPEGVVSLAAELSERGILTNTVSPGFINTDLTRKILSKKEMDNLAKTVPMGRFGDPEEIAEIVLFLASKKNTYITGQNIMVDGGFSIV